MLAVERRIQTGCPPVVQEGRLFHFLHRKINLQKLGGPFALQGEEYLRSPWKRALDLTVGIPALVFSLPLITAGALAIWAETPTQLPFRIQRRFGRYQKLFPMVKIRSQSKHTEGKNAIKPTSVGRFLRKTSIDEFPQLINVLTGHMSLVGPRPMLPSDYNNMQDVMLIHHPYHRAIGRFGISEDDWKEGRVSPYLAQQVRDYADKIRESAAVKFSHWQQAVNERPGITCLRQVLARRSEDNHRVQLDRFYVQHASLGFDIAILFGTIPAVLSRRGAR